ncbi:beta-taxilin [Sitophilus oryzae]|uniref:Beta-taxilin n=1 Tax=Sitophilus oryzae TaxID=7048 RepID=A0A6J2X537_SITOR|nr:beta-taxilin [Sitophilus oryzae]
MADSTTLINKKRKHDKYRRRDPNSIENIRKTTEAMNTEEKLNFISERYVELYHEAREMFVSLQEREKQLQLAQKDRNKDHTELTKLTLAKGQLENLCRELQKQNKLIKEENVARIKEEEDRRREVANTFTERLTALTNLITESKDKSNKFKEENQSMTDKLTELYKQYQQRENHLETVTKQLELQKKLAETQAKKVEIEHEAERQTFLAQRKALEVQLEQYEREIVLLQEKNRSLEAQVDLYKSEYSNFETTMTKSNKVFDTFKQEMSKMSKQLHLLESERNDLQKRWQSSVNSLIVLSEQHMSLANEQTSLEKKLTTLQKLCRQLQEERTTYLKQLKDNNIEPLVPISQTQDGEKTEQNTDEPKKMQDSSKRVQEINKIEKKGGENIANLENNVSSIDLNSDTVIDAKEEITSSSSSSNTNSELNKPVSQVSTDLKCSSSKTDVSNGSPPSTVLTDLEKNESSK